MKRLIKKTTTGLIGARKVIRAREIPSHDHMTFLARVRVLENGCWRLSGSKLPRSYSPYRIGGIQFNAHRVSFEIFKGPLVNGLVVDHVCMNRYCLNPDHLRQVTQRDNLAENTRSERVNRIRELNECKVGHVFSADNTIWFKRKDKKYRLCRECNRNRCKEKKLRRKALCA